MNEIHLRYLACPQCAGELEILKIEEFFNEKIRTGEIKCTICNHVFPIINYIPRFVPIENYASNFGIEWTMHSKTQYDSYSGINSSKKRFFEETKWDNNLEGEIILEVGSGSGRFTEQAASTNAFVISIDYSFAVEANYKSNGDKLNVLIIQGDIFSLPVKKRSVDKLFCIGVLQHTPNPEKAFYSLFPFVKNNGKLVIDVYAKTIQKLFGLKYLARYFTKKSNDPQRQYERIKKYVNLMWPLAKLISKIPVIGPTINWKLLIADHSKSGLKDNMLREWAYLDTFDMLSPRYDYPQTLSKVKKWFSQDNIKNSEVLYGYNGIEARGTIQWNDK